jgi:flagellar hook protein FlgE
MPILSGVSGNALASLTSIDSWIATLNSTVGGAARTGFKASHITFGGGTTRVDRLAANGSLGIQYAEQALNVGSTSIDFSQGQVVASTEFTHMAISGSDSAFFLLTDNTDITTANLAHYYYTRNGEFHRDNNGNLVNQDGLFLVGSSGTGNSHQLVNIQGAADPELAISNMIDNHNLGALTGARVTHSFVTDLQSLKFSKYGSTVYETANPLTKPPVVDADGNNSPNPIQSQLVRINGTSLEASNVQLPSSLVELSLAQKIYSALTKVIQIDQQKLDSILNLIR